MKVAIIGKERELIEEKLSEFGLESDKKNPDVVISFGGDGTALYGERVYPGIPRIMVKHSKFCVKSKEDDYSEVLNSLREKKYKIKEEMKVEVIVNDDSTKKLIGLNEVGIHHKIPTKALRLKIMINGKNIEDEQISDGFIVATPYGSTAYFYSICRKKFSKGLGIAFKNPKSGTRSMILDENSIIEAEVLRGIGLVAADNNEKMFEVTAGDKICESVSKEYKIEIAVAPQFTDICSISKEINIPILSQHLDPIKPGAFTGHVSALALKQAGAVGTLINHSERKLELNKIRECIQTAKDYELITVCCSADVNESKEIAKFNPGFIVYEPPELIGSGISVSQTKPEVVEKTVNVIKKINPNIKVLCGAGITKGEDVKKALELGTVGVLLASGVVKAKDPRKVLIDFAESIK